MSIDLQVQSKAWLESMHHLALARLASLLEQEVWSVADVPLHCQRIVDNILHRAGQESHLSPVQLDEGHAGKHVIGIISTTKAPPIRTPSPQEVLL